MPRARSRPPSPGPVHSLRAVVRLPGLPALRLVWRLCLRGGPAAGIRRFAPVQIHPFAPMMAQADIDRIKAGLPPAAYRVAPGKLAVMLLHAGIAATGFWLAGRTGLAWPLVPLALVTGHSLGCIGFLAHDLAHGSVVRHRPTALALERVFWGLVLISATVWRRVHNQSHHAHFNTVLDPDRMFLADERRATTVWYVRIFYPNAETFPWNPLVLLHLVAYVGRNTVTSLLPGKSKLAVVPAKAAVHAGDRRAILIDLGIIAGLQALLWLLTGRQAAVHATMLILSYAVTSALTMAYIFTNHFTDPLHAEPDLLHGTTSVIVPAWLDRLHSHFSYHTEHHLFPGLNSDYYPVVSAHLARAFPGSYSRIPILEAWRRLWRNAMFVPPPGPATPANTPARAAEPASV
ncbi:MAG TPA: fatty acid desaturase [Lacunisphaera sp.]|nr:fatty acid desaturase [Lacunisphaera sp.]